jgi:DNA repair protein RAD7
MAAGDLSDDEEAAERLADNMIIEQFDNCEICEVRFQVTAYSRTGPNGGLLCLKCTKDMDREKGGPNKRRKIDARMNRRKMESDHLDGIHRRGAKNLMSLCLETVVRNAEEASDLGDLPPSLVDRLAALMSKQRLINKTTLNLFLQPGSDIVTIYDGAKLSSDDYIRIFQTCSTVKHLRIRNAIQFKSNVMEYLTNCPIKLESFSIHGANLIDDVHWDAFLIEKGKYLHALKVYYTDGHFGDTQLEMLKVVCPDLVRLKVAHNQQVTDEGLKHIASLPRLQHLSLEIYKPTHSEPYVEILKSIGPGLRTFCLSVVPNVDDSVLQAIHDSCRNLAKLRITKSEHCTDAGFASLFTNWSNPPLQDIEFGECRDCNAVETIKNEDCIGLCSAGFEALMAHSGHSLTHLNVVSCRHIAREAFENAFAPKKLYPELREIDVSFCWGVDDFVVGSIFRCCPMLKTLKVFGDFGVKDVRVPRGRVLIGMPNAMGMQIEGDEESDVEAEKD